MNLTANETKALYYLTSDHEHLLDAVLKRSLKSASKKLYRHMFKHRRDEVYKMGADAARKDKKLGGFDHSYPPKNMGCLEQITWYDGYCSIIKNAKNPYRR